MSCDCRSIIKTVAEIPSILRLSGRDGTVKLQLQSLDKKEREAWELKIEKYRSACGCSSGAVIMTATSIIYPVIVGVAGLYQDVSIFVLIAGWAGSTIGMALLGKLLGIMWARHALKHTVSHLLKTVQKAAIG